MRVGAAAGYLALSCVIVGPLAITAAALVVREPAPGIPDVRDQAVFVTLGRADSSVLESVPVTLSWAPPAKLTYYGPSGVITSVDVGPGELLRNGQQLFSVASNPVRLFLSPAPLAAPVSAKSTSSDILSLNRFLDAVGLDVDPASTSWSRRTATAVKAYAKGAGWSTDASQFEPGWVVWASESTPFIVEGDLPAVGFPSPSAGDPVATGRQALLSAAARWSTSASSQGALELHLKGGERVPLGDDGFIAHDALAALAKSVESGAEETTLDAVLALPPSARTVPAGAVLASDSGNTCILATPEGGVPAAYEVRVLGGSPGVTYVDVPPAIVEMRVVANPVAAGVVTTC